MSGWIMKFSQLFETVGSTRIEDPSFYTSEMTRSYIDKLFFIDQIDADIIVDYGCADGFILSKIQLLRPNIKLVGYDLDETMLRKAREDNYGPLFTSSWEEVKEVVKGYKKPLLLLSSVIHEVYSYTHPLQVKKFWKEHVFSGLFYSICIRDMIPQAKISKEITFAHDVEVVRSKADPYYLQSYEQHWGSISDDYRTFIHFLLKYRYKDNWQREVLENYVPISLETLLKKIPGDYQVIYQENYIYSFFNQVVKMDFGIDIKQTTHTKMIIVKK